MAEEIKQHQTYWDKDNQIVRLDVCGDYDEQDAQDTVNKIVEIKQQQQGEQLKFLIDLSQATKPSSRARKIIVDKIYKDHDLEKVACVADTVLVRTVNKFLIVASGVSAGKIKVFATEEEALEWLKES